MLLALGIIMHNIVRNSYLVINPISHSLLSYYEKTFPVSVLKWIIIPLDTFVFFETLRQLILPVISLVLWNTCLYNSTCSARQSLFLLLIQAWIIVEFLYGLYSFNANHFASTCLYNTMQRFCCVFLNQSLSI